MENNAIISSQTLTQPAPTAAPAPAKTHHQYRALALVVGGVLTAALVAGGVLLHLNSATTSESGQTLSELQAASAALDPQIENLMSEEDQVFAEHGFSTRYYEIANTSAELQAKKDAIEAEIESLAAAENAKTIVTTGAIWFLVAAAFLLAISITVYLKL